MIRLNTIDTLVEQAIKANADAYRSAEKQYYRYTRMLRTATDLSEQRKADYYMLKDSYFGEMMAIKETLERLFPRHTQEIFEGLSK